MIQRAYPVVREHQLPLEEWRKFCAFLLEHGINRVDVRRGTTTAVVAWTDRDGPVDVMAYPSFVLPDGWRGALWSGSAAKWAQAFHDETPVAMHTTDGMVAWLRITKPALAAYLERDLEKSEEFDLAMAFVIEFNQRRAARRAGLRDVQGRLRTPGRMFAR